MEVMRTEDPCKHRLHTITHTTVLPDIILYLHDRVSPNREVKLVPRVNQSVHH